MRDARDDGRKTLKILRAHCAGTGNPRARVISWYTELTSLVKTEQETVTDYVIRAETAATALRNAGETVTESLLVAMVLKGLLEEYKPFVVAVTRRDKEQKFSEFKVAFTKLPRYCANQCNNRKSLCDEDGIQERIPVGDRLLSVRPSRAHCSLL